MAIRGAIPVSHEAVFPHGTYVVGPVEALEDFDRRQAGLEDTQARDKVTGLRMWQVRVVDVDPDGRKGQTEVVVKLAAEVQPVPPDALPGMPFRPVVFTGLTVTPWIDSNRSRPRIEYSFRASGMHGPGKETAAGPTKGAGEPGSSSKSAA